MDLGNATMMQNEITTNIEDTIDRSQLTEKQYLILAEYQKMLEQIKQINLRIESLNTARKKNDHNEILNDKSSKDNKTGNSESSSTDLIENLRYLENRIGLLFTLIKSSAFSFIVKHQQDLNYQDDVSENNENPQATGNGDHGEAKPNIVNNGILQSADGTVNVTLDSTR